jgi:3-oxoadipate enol-lactonase
VTTRDRRWLLLHGTPLTPAVWQPVSALLGPQPVLVPDLTSVPQGPVPQRTLAESIGATVTSDVDIVGHSFGGQIAIELALLVPDRVRSLTILCSRDTPYPLFSATASAIRAGQLPSIESSLGRWFSAEDLRSGSGVVERARSDLRTASAADWARALDAIARYDSSRRTPSLAMPVTLVAAGHDSVATPSAMKDLAGRLPDAKLHVHEDWFHMSPFVDSPALARIFIHARDRVSD